MARSVSKSPVPLELRQYVDFGVTIAPRLGSYVSKSDPPHADRPSQHLQLAPSHVTSRGSVRSQTLHHRDLPVPCQLKRASVPDCCACWRHAPTTFPAMACARTPSRSTYSRRRQWPAQRMTPGRPEGRKPGPCTRARHQPRSACGSSSSVLSKQSGRRLP